MVLSAADHVTFSIKAMPAQLPPCLADKVARLEDAQRLLYDARDAREAEILAQQLNNVREKEGIPPIQLEQLGQWHARLVNAISHPLICVKLTS